MPFSRHGIAAFPSSVSPQRARHPFPSVSRAVLRPSACIHPCAFGFTGLLSSSSVLKMAFSMDYLFCALCTKQMKHSSIALFSSFPSFCLDNQSTFPGLCYSPASEGLQTPLEGYPPFLLASHPLPSKHNTTLYSSFTHLPPSPTHSSLLLHPPPATSSMLSPMPVLLPALQLLEVILQHVH